MYKFSKLYHAVVAHAFFCIGKNSLNSGGNSSSEYKRSEK